MVITPGKNFDGQKGFPTPSDVPSDTACRSFLLPDDDEWLGLLMGAVELLLNPHNYFNYGALSIDDTVDHWQTIIQDAYDRSLLGTCAPMVDAPYWDTYGDSDDESSVEDQPWYGELVPIASMRAELLDDDELTWREHLGIWAIAGFIAYAGQIGAAIAFVPFAQRFVLKFRGNPLGAIAEIFVDGAKLAVLDTASAEDRIKAIDIVLPDDDEEHEIWVAVGEDSPVGSTLQVVRKELDPSEVSPTNIRYDAGTDSVQTTYDDGATWVDTPAQDPRSSPIFLYPPVGGDDPRCQAAANMVRFTENTIDETLGAIAAGLDAIGIATTILPLFVELGPFAILFDLVLGLASGLASAGATAISTAFTSDVYDELTCIIYCRLATDGSVDADQLANIESDISDQIGGLVSVIVDAMFFLTGSVGLSNMGTVGEAPADCDACTSCAWCYNSHAGARLDEWIPENFGGLVATYSAGAWHSASNGVTAGIWISWTVSSPVEFTDAGITMDDGSGLNRDIWINGDGTAFSGTLVWRNSSPVGGALPATVSRLDIIMVQAFNNTPRTLEAAQFSGIGDPPFGENNC